MTENDIALSIYESCKLIYTPDAPEIRLLELHPSDNFDARISCGILRVKMPTTEYYEALSYYWGDPKLTTPIQVNGIELHVTVNLAAALRYLRNQNSEGNRLLWVDAICIHQSDEQEKDYQVAMMRQIYVMAGRIIVWLGVDGDTARIAVKFGLELQEDRTLFNKEYLIKKAEILEYMSRTLVDNGSPSDKNTSLEQQIRDFRAVERSSEINLPSILRNYEIHVAKWDACASVSSHPWFARSWVIQEVLHWGYALAVVGDYQLPLDELCAALKVYHERKITQDSLRIRSLYTEDLKFLSGRDINMTGADGHLSAEKVAKVFDPSGRVEIPTPPGSWHVWFRSLQTIQSIPHTLLERRASYRHRKSDTNRIISLMLDFRDQAATDPRDKVYAFRGMALPEYDIIPSYSNKNTKADLYIQMARFFLQNSLVILFLVECPARIITGRNVEKEPSNDEVLPSWVPDWTQSQTLVARAMFAHHPKFSASAGFPYVPFKEEPRFRRTEVSETLTIRGIYVAVITATFHSHVTRDKCLGLNDAVSLIKYEKDPVQRNSPVPDTEWPSGDPSITFMNTSWGPYQTAVGDLVIIAAESNLPFIIRKFGEQYLFVGVCWMVKDRIQNVNKLQGDPGFDKIMFGDFCKQGVLEDRVELFELC